MTLYNFNFRTAASESTANCILLQLVSEPILCSVIDRRLRKINITTYQGNFFSVSIFPKNKHPYFQNFIFLQRSYSLRVHNSLSVCALVCQSIMTWQDLKLFHFSLNYPSLYLPSRSPPNILEKKMFYINCSPPPNTTQI